LSSVDYRSDIFDQILIAKDRVYEIASRTPLVASQVIPDSLLNLKFEHIQPTGSFKIRGATNAVLALTPEERELGIVCCSTGNHGRALAFVAKKLGIRITVCLSVLVPQAKVDLVRASGATVVQHGNSQDDALEKAIQIAESSGAKLIPPFDDPLVLGGQGTMGLEICDQMPDIDTLLIPLSGGEDEICDPALARQVGQQLGINVSILPNEGHMLELASVESALQRFCPWGAITCDQRCQKPFSEQA
jgi:threonine dehydratase